MGGTNLVMTGSPLTRLVLQGSSRLFLLRGLQELFSAPDDDKTMSLYHVNRDEVEDVVDVVERGHHDETWYLQEHIHGHKGLYKGSLVP